MTHTVEQKLALAIRITTIPPFMAAVGILILHRHFPAEYSLSSLFFLTAAPVAAYPIWWVIPKLREGGRRTQRALAVALSVAGYLAGSLWCGFVTREYASLQVYLIYLISGGLIALFSYVFGIRGSGHASGVVGPVAVMVWRLGPWYLLGAGLIAAVFWSSVKLGRHTLRELMLGGLFPIFGAVAVSFLPLG
ncbi:MAG TPA: hypothetical protein VN446_06925 [Candidatus Acidoferrum sp.]|nr:hypothetical protein [Candidatus Acidoferrum sp.]